MKYLLHIFLINIISINACVHNNEGNAVTTKPEDYSSAPKHETANSPALIVNDSSEKKPIVNKANDKYISVNDFVLISATSQDWTSGVAGGGRGTEYYFKIKITSEKELLFDKAWINKNAYQIFISMEQPSVSSQPVKYSNNDIITLRVSDIKNKASLNLPPPFEFAGAALISYTAAGRQAYFTIDEIKKLKTIYGQ